MANLFSKIFSAGDGKELRRYRERMKDVNALEGAMKERTDEELRQLSAKLKERAGAGESLDDLLPEAFALVREASARTLGLRHYDVQLIGAMALHDGCVAEMRTGEGKTLAATAAVYLNALAGTPVHVVTVNDYLARRDAEWMGPVYEFLGLSVGCAVPGVSGAAKKAAYAADVTYGTNTEMGFDYLRDNTATAPSRRVQRGHGFAIVDEADSILIDEARTPLVISGSAGLEAEDFKRMAEVVAQLSEDDVVIDDQKKTVYATEAGLDRVEELLGQEVYSDPSGRLARHLRAALRARFMLRRDVDYVVTDEGEVKIVDEFTGRVMEGRRYSDGVHQAIEAKEGVELKRESMTMASVTLQNYFRLYDKVAGMTGTALTEDKELRQIYKMPVVPIPTNKPVVRVDRPDVVYRTEEAKYNAVADEVERRRAKGQPVLIGTASVKNSEKLGRIFEERGIPHNRLNAKNHAEEAAIVAQAGRLGAVTIATNMAGRGTDILLGGNFEFLRRELVKNYRARDYEHARDWQIEAAESEARHKVTREGKNTRKAGGLFVIGTEKHESRRIDNQLRGRAGRQGDPGESRFYLSLEDELLVAFGGDRLKKVSEMMEKQGIGIDSPIEDTAVNKVIDAAQREMEAAHFNMRKQLLDFDDVMDRQRKAVYGERNAVLDGKDVAAGLPETVRDSCYAAVGFACPPSAPSDDWDYEALSAWWFDMTGVGADAVPTPDGQTIAIADIEHDEDPDALAEALALAMDSLLAAKRAGFGDERFEQVARLSMLQVLDQRWIAHLQDMDRLRQGIFLRAVGRREPLLEYKEESYDAFSELVACVYEDWLQVLLHLTVPAEGEKERAVISLGGVEPDQVVATQGEAAGENPDFSPITDNPLG